LIARSKVISAVTIPFMPDSAIDDAITDLALAAGRGDRTAASALIRSTQRDVWRFLVYLAGHADAEELTRETFVQALASVHRFTARRHARTWLLGIARRVAADHLRAGAIRPKNAPCTAIPPDTDDTAAINLAVRALAEDLRDAFVLTQVLGLGYAEAAEVCGCPAGTIRSRVARARQDLVAAFQAFPVPRRGSPAQRR
jgi:RNA polymerase sigma-70 factor (ECF subfamily)